jgi:uncharacterized protein (TIGR03083 family)
VVVDETGLEGLDPFDLLDAEGARVERHFTGAVDWSRPSRCAGWSTRDMLSHLAGVEDYNRACLDDDMAGLFARASELGVTDVHSFNDWMVRHHGARDTKEVLDEWRAANAAFRAEMRARGRSGSMATSVGPYPVGLQGFHLAMEYATHADDIGAAVDDAQRPARDAWRARFARFVLAEQDKPVEVETAGGRNVVRSGDEQAELSDDELVEASQGRLPADHPLSPGLREVLNTV